VSTSGHRSDPHLGGLVAAVVDGVLGHDARDRALAHLARCDECRAEVEAQRRLKARLARLGAPEVPGDLAARLLRLPDGAAGGATPGAAQATLLPEPPPVRLQASFRPPAPRSAPARPRRLAFAAAGGAAFTLGLASVLALGSPDRPRVVTPAVDSYTVEHSRSAVGVPGADPVVEAVDLRVSVPR
jgi:anti-sigma factor RsiW